MGKALELQKENASYMLKVRSAFYCTICDFHNHRYFDLATKSITIGESTCSDIA